MLRRSLFVSALMLAGIVGFASSAKAAPAPSSATVTMTGSVDNSCTVDNPVGGTLTPNTGKDILDSTGTSGKVDIACTGAASLEITSVNQTSGGTATNTVATLATSALGNAVFDSATPTNNKKITVPGTGLTKETTNLNLKASNPTAGTALTAGTYTYDVLITATPN